MDAIWTLAVGLLAPYVTKAGETLAQKAGETLFESIKKRFTEKKDKEGKKILADYKRNPLLYSSALEKILELNAKDKNFLAWLNEQILIAQKIHNSEELKKTTSVHQEINGRAVVKGQVIGVVQGNVHIGKSKSKD